jgi:hypothetical protein
MIQESGQGTLILAPALPIGHITHDCVATRVQVVWHTDGSR